MKNTKQIFTTVLSVLISVFLVAGVVYAVTTISTDIDTAGTLTVGVDGTSSDVTFYSDTAGAYMLWDESESRLYLHAVDRAAANLSPLHAVAVIDGATGYYYGLQSDVTKSGTAGIDDCTAVTAYLNQEGTSAFTVTGRFAPLQAILSGSGTVGTITKSGNGAVYAAWIANRGTQTNTDAVLAVHNQSAATATSGILLDLNGTVTNAIKITGTVTTGIDFSGTYNHAITIKGTATQAPLYTDVDLTTAANIGWLTGSSTATSGDLTGLRTIITSNAATPGPNVRGTYSQAECAATKFATLLEGVYATASAKGGSTVVTLKGAMFDAGTEATGAATTIANLYGAYIRTKTKDAITSDYYGLVIDSEKFATGIASDAALLIKDTTWGASETPYTVGILFGTTGKITTGIDLGDKTTTGIDIGSSTTGITFTGTTTNAITTSGAGISKILDATATMTGSSALTAVDIEVADSIATSGGISKGIYVNYAQSGAKTGNAEVNPIAVDMTISANVPKAFATSFYTAISGTRTVDQLSALYYYGDNLGSGSASINNWYALSLEMDNTNAPGGDSSFMYTFTHGNTNAIGSIIRLGGAGSTGTATHLLDFASATAPYLTGDPTGGGGAAVGRISIEVAGATHWIAVY